MQASASQMKGFVLAATLVHCLTIACDSRQQPQRATIDASAAPIVVTPAPSNTSTGTLQVLASGEDHPKFVALTPDAVLFTAYEGGVVRRVAKSGGEVTTLLSDLEDPYGIALAEDGETVAFATRATRAGGGGIWRGVANGRAKRLRIASEDFPSAVAIGGDRVAWVTRDSVATLPLRAAPGIAPRVIARKQAGPHGIAMRDGRVAWSNYHDGTVMIATANGEPVVAARGLVNPAGIAFAGGEVVVACTGDGSIRAIGVAPPYGLRTLTAAQPFVTEVAADATSVYFTTGAGVVGRVSVASGDVVVLARVQGTPLGIAIDDASVYWADERSGTVTKRSPR